MFDMNNVRKKKTIQKYPSSCWDFAGECFYFKSFKLIKDFGLFEPVM